MAQRVDPAPRPAISHTILLPEFHSLSIAPLIVDVATERPHPHLDTASRLPLSMVPRGAFETRAVPGTRAWRAAEPFRLG